MQGRQEGDHRKAFFTQEAPPRADQKPTEKSGYETNPKASEHEFVSEQKTGQRHQKPTQMAPGEVAFGEVEDHRRCCADETEATAEHGGSAPMEDRKEAQRGHAYPIRRRMEGEPERTQEGRPQEGSRKVLGRPQDAFRRRRKDAGIWNRADPDLKSILIY